MLFRSTGNYSITGVFSGNWRIITYQVITGNYSVTVNNAAAAAIITYQVITGNYSSGKSLKTTAGL